MTEVEMVGWHHQLNGHESEQTPVDSEEQRSLACCSPWGHEESDTTEQPNKNNHTPGSRPSPGSSLRLGKEKRATEDEMVGWYTNSLDMNLDKLWEIESDKTW